MMEKYRCKLCFRSFSNGRALGGHMRSHMMNLPLPPKPNESPPPPPPPAFQLSFEAESASSPSSSFEENNKGGSLSYRLREKPKRNFRFSDPEFLDAGSVILQENMDSESESSRNLTRKRSKRTQRYESTSSASDTTTDEDVAFCLMMLSRDKWKRKQHHELVDYDDEDEDEDDEEEDEEQEQEDEEIDDESEEEEEVKASNRVRGRYKCETCSKTFRSYQALGGHRASHKKIKVVKEDEQKIHAPLVVVEKKVHECPVCFRVFGSGQALGGHKRTHVIGSAAVTAAATVVRVVPVPSSPKFGDSLLDLNLPAPLDDDDVSQIDGSAVSDAEFLKFR